MGHLPTFPGGAVGGGGEGEEGQEEGEEHGGVGGGARSRRPGGGVGQGPLPFLLPLCHAHTARTGHPLIFIRSSNVILSLSPSISHHPRSILRSNWTASTSPSRHLHRPSFLPSTPTPKPRLVMYFPKQLDKHKLT